MNTLPLASPIVNPRDSWPAWTDADRWEPTPDDPGDEPRPTVGPDFAPTRLEELEALGRDLGHGGEEAPSPRGLDDRELAAFTSGFAQGRADLDAERDACLEAMAAEHDRMEAAFGGPELTWHPAELAEARSHAGHPA
jgi:hypothetical protein